MHQIRYVNTDLDLEAPQDLRPLADALVRQGLLLLHVRPWKDGLWTARFESAESFPEPQTTIGRLLSAIESLDTEARRQWAACTSRTFDIGYDCGSGPWGFNQQLETETLARIAAAEAGVRITIYAEEPPLENSPQPDG